MRLTRGADPANGGPFGSEAHHLGAVRISRSAVRTMIEEAALRTAGVEGLSRGPRAAPLGHPIPWEGIGLAVRGQSVWVDLYLLARRGVNLAIVGARAQEAVATALELLLGLRVVEINVFIQDVV